MEMSPSSGNLIEYGSWSTTPVSNGVWGWGGVILDYKEDWHLWKYYVWESTCVFCNIFCAEILCNEMLNSAEHKITTQCLLQPISVYCNMQRQISVQQIYPAPQSLKLPCDTQFQIIWQNMNIVPILKITTQCVLQPISVLQHAGLDVASDICSADLYILPNL